MKLWPTIPLGFCLALPGGVAYAQPLPPITSSGLNTQVSAPVHLPGGAVQHNITGGTRPGGGGNLFHSFGDFGVPTNNVANFLNDSGLPTSNILSRVTGGNSSNILGTIQTEGFGNANLFLMNPAGIVFGPNASLNVGGSTHFTTADYLRLSDGVQFTALPSPQDALLSVAPVAAFGFLDSNPASITVQENIENVLTVSDAQTLSLVGGDITIGRGANAPAGQIVLASVASPGEMLIGTYDSAPHINEQTFTTMGNITLSEGVALNVSEDAAGSVIIRGGQLMMTNATISADTVGSDASPMGIDIDVTGDVSISTVDGPALTARTSGVGNAGEVKLASGGNIDISGTASEEFLNEGFFLVPIIDTHTSGSGNGGSVAMSSEGDITVTGDLTEASLVFLADTGTDGFNTGEGGDFSITAKNFESLFSTISTGNYFSFFNDGVGAGHAGNVTMSVSGRIDLSSSDIITDSFDFNSDIGGGEAGDVAITAQEIYFDVSNISTNGWVRGGNVAISTDTLTLSERSSITTITRTLPGGEVTIAGRAIELVGSNIVSTTNENANAGDISITATEQLSLLNSGSLFPEFDRPSGILSNSFSNDGSGILGAPGDILISTPKLNMSGGSRVNTTSGTSGNGGNVLVTAQKIFMSGETSALFPEDLFNIGQFQPTGIFTRSIGGSCAGTCGDAGNVNITTDSIVLEKGAQINSGTSTDGDGGGIIVSASDTITISGTLEDGTSGGLLSRTSGTEPGSGAGGEITLTAGQSFTLSDGARVSASSEGLAADAGDIQLTAKDTILIDKATVTTEAVQASGGNITLTANDMIQLTDSTIASSVQGDATTVGGDVTLDPDFIILQNSQILAKAVAGKGGNIDLVASKAVLLDSQSTLDASSQTGISGSVTIESPIQVLSGTIVPLPDQPVNVATLYASRCVAGEGGHFSTFVDSKSDGVAPTPGTFLASPFLPQVSSSLAGALGHAYTPAGIAGAVHAAPIQVAAYATPVLFQHGDGMRSACP